jgi:predicted AAA+ superfamily ATPase
MGDFLSVYKYITSKLKDNEMNYIILDEVQNIKEFERLVDGLFIKDNCDVYITGSNATLLSGELATLLTGRYIEIKMLPFSFFEYSKLSNPQKLSKMESFTDYIYSGGIPESIKIRKTNDELADEYLRNIFDTLIYKDIYVRHIIRNKPAFERTVDFLLDSIGSFVSPNSIANSLTANGFKINNETIANYLELLTSSMLFYKVPRYDIKGKRLLQTINKYYVVDNGLRKVRLDKTASQDLGHLLENVVYFELLRRYSKVSVGKVGENEIDFIAYDSNGYISYYQVAWSTINKMTLDRELKPLAAIKDNNAKYLLTTDFDINPSYNGIKKLNVVDWALSVNQ